MSAELLNFTGITKLDIPPERVLDRAAEAGLTDVLVLGWTAGGEFYAAASAANVGDNLRLAETFKHKLISGEFGE